MKRIHVLAWPAYKNKDSNPYNHLLYNSIEELGVKVSEFHFNLLFILKVIFFKKFDILHMHWPQNILLVDKRSNAARYLYTFNMVCFFLKLQKKKIVWTVHNIDAHESNYPDLQFKLDNLLFKYTTGFISLNRAALPYIESKLLNDEHQQITYIPHLHYGGYYQNVISRKESRKCMGIDDDKFVFLFLGQIRPYKNIDGLIRAFKELNDNNTFLLIAGNVQKNLIQDLEDQIKGWSNIKLYRDFVQDKDIQLFMNSSDIVVTPYNKILNSGSVFMNLGFEKPTLAPRQASLPELQSEIGDKWIKLYEGSLNAAILNHAMTEIIIENLKQQNELPEIEYLHPKKVALETINFYKFILNNVQ